MGSSETLRSVIDAGRTAKRLDELSTARVVGKIAEQIHAAQQKAGAGKAIGPVTPAGITFEANGAAKLGLAEPTAFAYSSPEQLGGSDGDRRSDVFSLGVIMWEALTHDRLFDATGDAAIKAAVTTTAIVSPCELNANIPAELGVICLKALARNPSDRYQSTKVMAAEIEAVLDDAGYGDTDEKIAEFIAALGKPRIERKVTLPPLTTTPAQGVGLLPIEPAKPAPAVDDKTTETPTLTDWDAKEKHKQNQKAAKESSKPAPKAGEKDEPRVHAQPTQPPIPKGAVPSILDKAPTAPPSTMSAPSAGSLSPTSFLKPGTAPPPVAAPSGANFAAALASAGTSTPAASTLPAATSSPTTPGFASGAVLSEAAKLDAVPPPTPAKPSLPAPFSASIANAVTAPTPALTPTNGGVAASPAKAAIAAAIAKSNPGAGALSARDLVNAAPSSPPPTPAATSPAAANVATAAASVPARSDPTPAPVEGARKRPPTNNPNPAAVVSLPNVKGKTGRESQEVLGGWGWGTDSHAAIQQYEEDEDLPVHSNRKPLLYAIGGGLALAAIITIVAVGFGGSTPEKKPSPSAATKEGDASGSANLVARNMGSDIQYGSNSAVTPEGSAANASVGSSAPGSDTAPAAGSDTAAQAEAAKAEADKAEAAKAEAAKAEAAKAEADKAEAAKAEAAKAEAAKADAANAKAEAAKAEAAKKEAAKQDAAAKAEAAKAEVARKKEAAKAEAATRAEAAKAEAARKAEAAKQAKADAAAHKRPPEHKDQPKPTVAKVDPKPDTASTAKEVESAYRQGLQQFMRGDTTAALASLRTSLAGNPNYAPTWRGLGLVFEKMGEKDQARSAFKRYLQLAPTAGDADQIRNRLERLGT